MARSKKTKKNPEIDNKKNITDSERERKKILTPAMVIFILILTYAVITHFYDLGYKAYHHDEGIHVYYSWNIAKSGPASYKYDPVYHGPFLYFANAFVFRLWGGFVKAIGNDFNGRVVPALFGIFLIFLFYGLKNFVGTRTALFITLLGAVSPTLTYFSRFLRHDIYITVYTLGIVICFLYYWREKNFDCLYFSFALLALSFVTKEDTYIILFVMGSFAFFYYLVETALNCLYEQKNLQSCLNKSFHELLEKKNGYRLIFSILFLKIITLNSLEYYFEVYGTGVEKKDLTCSLKRIICDIKSQPVTVLNSLFIFFVIYTVFFTSFFTNPRGLFTGITGFFTYWVFDQQLAPRIPGAFYYYLSKLCLYEFTVVVFVLMGIGYLIWKRDRIAPGLFYSGFFFVYLYSFYMERFPWMAKKPFIYIMCAAGFFYLLLGILRMILYMKEKDSFISFVIYWTLSVLSIYSYAQEKVPWLMVPVVLPMIILAGLCIGKIFDEGTRVLKYITVIILALLLPYNIYVSYRLNFLLPDNPIEPMVFTQTTRDLVNTSDKIKEIVKEMEDNKVAPSSYTIYVDNEVSWPVVWYLKDYKVTYTLPLSIQEAQKAVVVVSSMEKRQEVEPFLSGNFSGERLKLRAWWLADNLTFFHLLRNDFSGFLKILYRFVFFREVWNNTGSTDYMLYLRKDFSELPAIENSEEPEFHNIEERPLNVTPEAVKPSSITGNYGMGDGQFMYPRGVDMDNEGNIYVADSYNHRIQKFSPRGKFITSWGREGTDKGLFQQPCGLAVDGDRGYVFVADTWNHRVQRFSLDGNYQTSWGEGFYGPRDIVVDKNGDLYLSDTGNCIIRKYNSDGLMECYFGSRGTRDGSFREPIGMALDKEGNIIIADTWNQRIQVFSPDGKYIKKFDVAGWYGEGLKEPYIAVDSKGDIILTDTSQKRLLVYNSDGKLKSAWSLDFFPVGIALGDNKIVLTDFSGHSMKLFDYKL